MSAVKSEFEDSVLCALLVAQHAQSALDDAVKSLLVELKVALEILVQPGDIIDRRSFGTIAIAGGNARGAQRFEVAAEAPRITDLKPAYPELTRFLVSAWPLNSQGERMSGRSGNSRTRADETVTLCIYLCSDRINDKRSSNEIFMEVIAKAAGAHA